MLILLIGGADYRLLTHNPKIPVLREKRHKANIEIVMKFGLSLHFRNEKKSRLLVFLMCVSQHVNGGKIKGLGKVKVV